eukprot:4530159-Prymnesium_polylepis.1
MRAAKVRGARVRVPAGGHTHVGSAGGSKRGRRGDCGGARCAHRRRDGVVLRTWRGGHAELDGVHMRRRSQPGGANGRARTWRGKQYGLLRLGPTDRAPWCVLRWARRGGGGGVVCVLRVYGDGGREQGTRAGTV